MQLTDRQERVLRTIVERYITTAHPVGSAAIVGASGINFSSATVRNEMALLEELRLIYQLHTSGGRVPTHAGYRYYVERLMGSSQLASSEATTIRHQFHQAHTELQEWLKLAASIMAHRMHNVGLVTAPKSAEVRLRHLEAISIQNTVVLLIVVIQDGTVLQELVPLSDSYTQEQLSAMADRLGKSIHGMTAAQVEAMTQGTPSLDHTIAGITAHLLRRGEAEHAQVFHAGLPDMIRQPEFADSRPGGPAMAAHERVRTMLDFLHQGLALQQLLSVLPADSPVQIVIGADEAGGLAEYSFVLGRYGRGADDSSGVLGIVGPTRMEYPRAVALVRYMTDLMTDLLGTY